MNNLDLKAFLDSKVELYNTTYFIETDPISIPHQFKRKEDIEISAFFSAILAWGNRTAIIKTVKKLMQLMDFAPYDFVVNSTGKDLNIIKGFVYRTFNEEDALFFIERLKYIYSIGGLEDVFTKYYLKDKNVFTSIALFRDLFLAEYDGCRSAKHVANVRKNSAAKRINMFLRWMVRDDKKGVDFGMWKDIHASDLMMPLDVHSGRVARKLGLLSRKQDDWKAVEELTASLRKFDAHDPIKYDFALFGLGVFEKF